MKVRVISRSDGGVTVIHAAPKSWRKEDIKNKKGKVILKKETKAEWLDRVFKKSVKALNFEGRPYQDIDDSELPIDREFRDAWELDSTTKKIKINTGKKKQIEDKIKISKKKDEILERQAKQELGIS